MEKKTGIDPEEFAKKFPIMKYDVQPNANGNAYSENAVQEMLEGWSSQKSLSLFQTDPILQHNTEEVSNKIAKEMEKKVHDAIMSGIPDAAHASIPNTPLTARDFEKLVGSVTSQAEPVRSPEMDKHLTIKKAMHLMSPNDLIDNALTKLGRQVTIQSRKAIRDYMIRVTKSHVFDKDQPGPPGKDSEFTKPLFEELLDIEGVEKAEVMLNDYPESVSIIIRINMSDFPDDMVEVNMDKIDYAIQANKPQYLDKLEVLFHNKVVY